MSEEERRAGDRVTVHLRVRLACTTLDEMVERFAVNVSAGGFRVRSREPKPVGTELTFELTLAGGEPAVRGRGVVRWVSPTSMGIQFAALDGQSRSLVDRMVARRAQPPPSTPGAPITASSAPRPTPVPFVSPLQDPSGALPTLPKATAAPGPAQADLTVAHRVQQVKAGPIAIEIGLPSEPIPVTSPSKAVIGIDLGTTNSCAAIVKDGKPYVIPSREGYNTVPSIVAVNARQRLVVGQQARSQLLCNPANTIVGAKRLVGREFHSPAVQAVREAFSYEVFEGEGGLAEVRIGGIQLTLEQVSALILKEVKELAQNHLGEEVNRAVITVPAYYNERQRAAVRRAGALAGLQVERIVNEPTAAALAYAYGRNVHQRVLVYDLGGGTFDASVLELQDLIYEVVSTGGDTFLGGTDFDLRIVAKLLELYELESGQPFDGDRVALSRLMDAAERAKCALSQTMEQRVQLPFLTMRDGQPVGLDATISRQELVDLVEPLVERTIAVCRDVLASQRLEPENIDEVILVGGQSRMPLVHEKVQALFGKAPSRAVHPDEAVAIGAALLAYSLNRAEGLVLIDVLPMAIGISSPEGKVRRVFGRNTPLPARRQYGLTTTRDGQTEFDLVVVQGDATTANECEYLGTLHLDGLPSGPRGMVKIAVTFELGAECLLTVTARDLQTNRSVKTTLAARGRRGGTPNDSEADLQGPRSGATPPDMEKPAATQAPSPVGSFLRRLLGREAR